MPFGISSFAPTTRVAYAFHSPQRATQRLSQIMPASPTRWGRTILGHKSTCDKPVYQQLGRNIFYEPGSDEASALSFILQMCNGRTRFSSISLLAENFSPHNAHSA